MRAPENHRIVTAVKGPQRRDRGRIAVSWALILAIAPWMTGAMAEEEQTQLTTSVDNSITTTAAQRLNSDVGNAGYGYPGGAASPAYDRGAFTPLRLDLLSALDVDYGPVGLRTSGLVRIENAQTSSGAGSGAINCQQSSRVDIDLAPYVCRGSHAEAELREAFAHGSTSIAEQRLTLRAGRHTLIWGESVYFAGNGIAAGQAPIDTSLVEKISGYQGEPVFLPVGQVSASWQPTASLAVDAYYQFEWRRSRIGALGQYVDVTKINGGGATPAVSGPIYLARGASRIPNSSDQYGVAVKFHSGDRDYGLYALSFDAKVPTLQFHPNAVAAVPGQVIGTYNEDFPRGIQIYGMSVAGPLGAASYGAEISARRNMPLVNGPVLYPPGYPFGAERSEYPLGDTLHAQFSWNYMSGPLPGVPDGAKWTGEIAANSLLQTTAHPGLRTLDRTRTAAALRTVIEPQFLQALPRLDLRVPIGVGVNFLGLSAVDPQMNRGTGDVSVALVATYNEAWSGALSVTHYFGTAKNVFPYEFIPAGRPLSDADFVSLSVQRSF